jgi:hypothetical protein
MFIQTEATPNPATLKFLPGRAVLEKGTLDLRSSEEAAQSPLAERLLAIPGVSGVFFGSDFITITKNTGEWQQLKPMILGTIMEHFMSGAAADSRNRRGDRRGRVLRYRRRRDRGHHQGADRNARAAGRRQ